MDAIEWIKAGDDVIAVIIRSDFKSDQTVFITPNSYNQQAGLVVYPAGGRIQPHDHKPIERHTVGTMETLIVRTGRMEVELFDSQRVSIAKRDLAGGDVLVLVSGGHGFRMLEDTILLEIKQGPYTGLAEKERF